MSVACAVTSNPGLSFAPADGGALGTADWSMGYLVNLDSLPSAASDLCWWINAGFTIFAAATLNASNQVVGTAATGSATSASSALSAGTWYGIVIGRVSGVFHCRVINPLTGAIISDQSVADTTNIGDIASVNLGGDAFAGNTADQYMANFIMQTGAYWSDEEAVVQLRHFGVQLAGGTDRHAFRLEDITDTFDGLNSIPDTTTASVAMTDNGCTTSATRSAALEPLGIRVRQIKHTPELDTGGSTVVAAFDDDVLAGSVIDAAVGWSNGSSESPGSCADGGDSFSEITACRQYNATHSQLQSVFSASNVSSGAKTVTVTLNGSRTWTMLLITEIAGAATTSPLDASSGDDVTSATPTGTAVVPTTAGQAILSTYKDHSDSDIGVTAYQTGAQPIPCVAGSVAIDMASQFYVRRVAHTMTHGLTLGASRDVLVATRSYKPAVVYGVSDDADRTNENPLSDGGGWTAGGGGLSNLQVTSNAIRGATAASDCAMYRNDTTAGDDQWVAAVLNGTDIGLLARMDGSGNGVGLGQTNWIYMNAGTYTTLGSHGLTLAASDEILVEIIGASRIAVVWQNGVLAAATTLGSGPTSGGDPGAFCYDNDGTGELYAWAGGGLWDAPVATSSEQAAFGWFNDDNNEATATAIAAENTGVTLPSAAIARVRIQVAFTGDLPSGVAKAQFKKTTDGTWLDLPETP